jgi:hypothetical protein
MSWLTLSEVKIEASTILVRLCPERFIHDGSAPVTEVRIEGVEDPEAARATLARFRGDFVVGLEIDPSELRLLGEMDDDWTVVKGRAVASVRVPYSLQEIESIAVGFERALGEERATAHRSESRVRKIRQFVADLITRAEKKRSMSERNAGVFDSQTALLQRVLHRIDDT